MAKITVEYLQELLIKIEDGYPGICKVVELLNEKASEPEWISVKEQLPEMDHPVDVYTVSFGRICNVKRDDEMFRHATHWIPLPNKPVN